MGIIMKDGHQYGIGGIGWAENVSYDNTESGMTATNVQGALDELSAGLMTAIQPAVCTVSQSDMTTGKDLTNYVTEPTGYKFLCWIPAGLSSGWVTTFPIYLAKPMEKEGTPWYQGTIGGAVDFMYLLIRTA